MTANATVPVEWLNDVKQFLAWFTSGNSVPRDIRALGKLRGLQIATEATALRDRIAAAPQPEATQEVDQVARELLLAEYDKEGLAYLADAARQGRDLSPNTCALRAIVAALTRNPQPVDLGQFREADVARTVDFDGYKLSVMADGSVMVSQGARLVVLIDRQPGDARLEVMAKMFECWIEFAEQSFAKEGKQFTADMWHSPPAWPTRCVLEAWIAALRGGQPS